MSRRGKDGKLVGLHSLLLVGKGARGECDPARWRQVVSRVFTVPAEPGIIKRLPQAVPDVAIVPASLQRRRQLTQELQAWGKAPVVWLMEKHPPHLMAEARDLEVANIVHPKACNESLHWSLELARKHFEETARLRREAREAREALEARKLVERAKAALMQNWGISDDEAYRRLQRQAMDSRRSLRAVAEAVLKAGGISV